MKTNNEIIEVKQEVVPVKNEADRLIEMAVDKNVSPENLEKLMALKDKLIAQKAEEEFYKSLAAFQGECPIVEKRKKVSFNSTTYSYAPLEDIVEQVKPFLSKHGFSYMFDTETNGKMKVICKVKHIAGHSEVATFAMEIDTNSKMNISQKYGSGLTYAKRYAFCAAFAINVKDEDTDSNAPQNIQNSSPDNARQEIRHETTNGTISEKCAICYATGKFHRPDCPNGKTQEVESVEDEHFCKIHNKPMKRREAQNGGHYYDHRFETVYGGGDWNKCNGLPKKVKEDFF